MSKKLSSNLRNEDKKNDLKQKQIEELNFWKNISENKWRGFSPQEWRVAHIDFKQYSLIYINRSIANLENKFIIEVGCGLAGIVPFLHNSSAIGIDPLIDEYEKIWNLSNDRVKYIISEIESFESDKKADILICWNVLDHVSDINLTTKKLYDLLKPDGELWFLVNLEDSSFSWRVKKTNHNSAHPYKVNLFSISRLFKSYKFYWKEKVLIKDQINSRKPILMGVLGKNT